MTKATTSLPCFVTLTPAGAGGTPTVGTLGPPGTSSELAATLLAGRLGAADPGTVDGGPTRVRLFDTYERAGSALRARLVTHVVVANAYKAVHEFYMDPGFQLAVVFVLDTPMYGIAKRRGAGAPPPSPTIASHPSPVPIIGQLLNGSGAHVVMHADSTSSAALAAAEGRVDLALTTAPAAQLYDLEFITRTRCIRMVWSVFVLSDAAPATTESDGVA
ncbi:hypothetical protein HCB17_15810 [Salinispora arenicola]|uniref:hypothetical protein n=1 Tax=Salinispora arenicola TaxID=168697 RepID=UPI0003820500|nr:hypothetical protein [Salinispora arenicola]NIL42463.1 hypothetical protein [Salinispora arenicola]